MNPYVFQAGNFGLRWYTLFILIGVIIGCVLILFEAKKLNIRTDFVFNAFFWTVIMGFLGARIYYVLFNYNLYKGDFFSIFKIWEGGLAIHGGIIAGFITTLIYCKKYDVKVLRILDIYVPALFLAQALGRWGNFFNGEAHGGPTSLARLQSLRLPKFIIEGMNISGIYYEPTFLYESIACLVGFLIIIIVRRLKYTKIGVPTSLYLIIYGIARFFIENMRTDALKLGGFKVAQIVSIVFFLIGVVILMIISRKSKFEDLYLGVEKKEIKF